MTRFMKQKVDFIQKVDRFCQDIDNFNAQLNAKVDAFNVQQISRKLCEDEKVLDRNLIDVFTIDKSTCKDVNDHTIHDLGHI